ncbi:MAG: hypothetical protein IIB61_04140 [Planctomycetes bacterium]|nr:hypothetical protein [Planctomycetota bacterium]
MRTTPEQAAEIGDKLSPRFLATGNETAQVRQQASGDTARAEARGSGDARNGTRRSTFLDRRTSLEVDLSFVPVTGFLADVIARGTKLRIGSDGPEFNLVTPEDIILMKLEWRKDTRSQKQWDNALGVARVRGARMDWKYLFETARTLGIEDDLIKLRDEAGI